MSTTTATREARRVSSSRPNKTADKRIAITFELTPKQFEILEAAAKTLRLPVAQAASVLMMGTLSLSFDNRGEFIAQHFDTLELMEQDRLCLDPDGRGRQFAVEEG